MSDLEMEDCKDMQADLQGLVETTIVDEGEGSYTYLRFDDFNESWATPHQEAELDDEVVAELDRDTFSKLLDRLQSWGCNLNVDLDYYDEFHEE